MIAHKNKKLNTCKNNIKIRSLEFKLVTVINALLKSSPTTWNVVLQDMYDSFVSSILTNTITCPVCKGDEFSFCGTYTRRLYLLNLFTIDNHHCFMNIDITRITCKCCHKTYSIHPYWMIPYCPFTILEARYIICNDAVIAYNAFKRKIPYHLFETMQKRIDDWLIHNQIYMNKIVSLSLDEFLKYFYSGTHPPFLWKHIDVSLKKERSFNQIFSYLCS